MEVIAPDVLSEACGLPPSVTGTAWAIGALLWLTGWRWHRFWIVLAVTVAGGIVGLQAGRQAGPQLLIIGLLVALSAGLLALELTKVLAFVAAGAAAWFAYRMLAPSGGEPVVAFLVGGLAGVLMFRFWIMVLSSLSGAVLAIYAGLCLSATAGRLDPPTWAARQSLALNIGVAALTVLGVIAQSVLVRWLDGAKERRKQKALAVLSEEERAHLKKLSEAKKPTPSNWWNSLFGSSKKKKAA